MIHHPDLVNLQGCSIGDETRIGTSEIAQDQSIMLPRHHQMTEGGPELRGKSSVGSVSGSMRDSPAARHWMRAGAPCTTHRSEYRGYR